MNPQELMGTLRGLLREVLRARFDGALYAKLARAHGYADGYMRALMDAKVASREELLALVAEERRQFSGDPLAVVEGSDVVETARIVAA